MHIKNHICGTCWLVGGCWWWFVVILVVFGDFSVFSVIFVVQICHICCHICIIFVILFHGTSKVSMCHEIFFYTNLIHPRGQLWAELLQTLRTFSGRKWLLKEKIAIFWHKYWFFEKIFFGRLCPRAFLVISICHKIVLKAQFF